MGIGESALSAVARAPPRQMIAMLASSTLLQKLAGGEDPRIVEQGDYTYASGVVCAKRLLAMIGQPSAIVAANDLMALGAIEAAASFGLRVPEDISVVGIDDIFVASLPWINLTTLRQPKWNLGVEAARLILERIQTGAGTPRRIIIEPEFIRRGTTGPAATEPSSRHDGGSSSRICRERCPVGTRGRRI